eukprot:1636851-Pyramimonas_sp.AAC.1
MGLAPGVGWPQGRPRRPKKHSNVTQRRARSRRSRISPMKPARPNLRFGAQGYKQWVWPQVSG